MLIGAEDLVCVDASDAAVVAKPFAFHRRTVVIDVAGSVCAVHFDSDAAAAAFAARYADLMVFGIVPQRHAFAMRDPAYGWLFWSEGSRALRWPHGDLAAHVVAFLADAVALTEFFQRRDDGIVSLHGASIGLPGGMAAIIGDSNAGKTTTAIACARAEMDLYSDERCLIDRWSRVHPFPRAINVREGGLRLLAHDRVDGADSIGTLLRAHGSGDWNDVRISDLAAGGSGLEPRSLCAAFLLAGRAQAASLEAVSAGRAVHASARWAQGAGAGLEKVARLFEIFGRVPCYRLRLGTPHESARLIRSVVEWRIRELERTA